MRSRVLAVPLLAIALAACGSTVQDTGAAVSGSGGSSDGLGAPVGSGTGGALAPGGSSTEPGLAPPAVGDGSPGLGGTSVQGARPGDSALPGPRTGPGNGPLVPAKIKVGIQYSSNGTSAAEAFGVKYSSDYRPNWNAVIRWINAHGGIAGRPVEAAFHDADATTSPQAISEDACTQWTQDDKVTLAIPGLAVADNNGLRACLHRAGVPAMQNSSAGQTRESSFAASPSWFENVSLSLESYASTYVRGLAGQGFFRGAKVGVIYYDRPHFKAAFQSHFLPALRAVGVGQPIAYAASMDGVTTAQSGASQMSNAILAFRRAGVNRVLFYEPWNGWAIFMQQANAQAYYPLYGLSSQGVPQSIYDLGIVPARQLQDARIVGWQPMMDVRDYQKFVGPQFGLCVSIFRKAGILASEQTLLEGQIRACEALLLTRDALARAPRTLTPSDVARGIDALGAGARFATRPHGSFTPTKHWGPTHYRPGRFDSARGVFVYDGPARRVS